MAGLKRSKGVHVKKSISMNSAKSAKRKGISSPDKIVPFNIDKTYKDVEKALNVKIDREQTPPENVVRLYNMMLYTGRTTVGSRNPYAAVEHELGIKIDWAESNPAAVKQLMKKGAGILQAVARKDRVWGEIS